jgi:phage tail-like protein
MPASPSTQGRTYSAAHFVLELETKNNMVGVIRSVDGGGVKSEIMTYQSGASHETWRQIGKPKYEDLKIEFGMAMSQGFYTWIQSFFDGQVLRKDGAVVAADFHYNERARREFQSAIISEITFPQLDGTDKNPCFMTATIVPETLRFAKGSSNKIQANFGEAQRLWTPANFELRLDGFGEACRRVTKIDGFTIKQQVHEYHAGHLRDPMRVPGLLEFPNLSFYLPEADAQPFIEHYTKYGIGGELQKPTRHTGSIVCLDNSQDPKELCTVTLEGVDVASISPQKQDSSSEDIKLVKVELAIENMKFEYKSDAVG